MMNRLWMVVSLLLALTLHQTSFSAEPYEETLRHAQKLPLLINSCEIKSEKLTNGITYHVLKIDGDKFYNGYTRSLDERHSLSYGFDGTTYWDRSNVRGQLSQAGFGTNSFFRVGLGGPNPLTAPYNWFWGDVKKASWSYLRSANAWADVITKLKFEATQSIRNHTCDVFSIQYPELKRRYRMALSRELGGFPIQVELTLDDKVFAVLDVLKSHQDPSGAVVGIEFQSTRPGKEPVLETVVDPTTIRINMPIDQVSFEFDPAGIELLVDVDAREKAKSELKVK